MEYTNHKSGEEISRDQYIANGLERGELLIKEDCGCVVIQDRTADAYIVYCPKHESAPDLYEALKEIHETELNADVIRILQPWLVKVEQALAKAKP